MTEAERNAYVRDKCWAYWGVPPSAKEQKRLADIVAQNVDLGLAAITDDPRHEAFRKKRGW